MLRLIVHQNVICVTNGMKWSEITRGHELLHCRWFWNRHWDWIYVFIIYVIYIHYICHIYAIYIYMYITSVNPSPSKIRRRNIFPHREKQRCPLQLNLKRTHYSDPFSPIRWLHEGKQRRNRGCRLRRPCTIAWKSPGYILKTSDEPLKLAPGQMENTTHI